jgi:hypothetical protein
MHRGVSNKKSKEKIKKKNLNLEKVLPPIIITN